ncbi:MAG: DUF4954 family protein [Rikenellaceae bacterium]
MCNLRVLTQQECDIITSRGSYIEDCSKVWVSPDFTVDQVWQSRLLGRVDIHTGVVISRSTVSNYAIKDGAMVDSVARLEGLPGATFGNGVRVAVLNENGGREVVITDNLTAQVAYIWAMWRHLPKMVETLEMMAHSYSAEQCSDMGVVGRGSKLLSCGVVRNLYVDSDVVVEGASHLENGTLLSGARVGADVKARDFIAVEGSRLNNGAVIERSFIGERVIVSNGFTLLDSLVFSSSHLEAGEGVSIFAGPYTVSHHKSTLLIAGAFSFFNAGSGSNQSNHLFKSGAVHQAQHLRGVKFASNGYVMAPAIEGAFTTVIGRNSRHHDTSDFPFSILIESEAGRSSLIPAANINSYGTVRDVEKWQQRDSRSVKRDVVSYPMWNPYITMSMIRGLNTLHSLSDASPLAESYTHNRVMIKPSLLKRGVQLYNKGIAAALGVMLSYQGDQEHSVSGEWCDVAGQYIAKGYLDGVVDDVESGELLNFEQIQSRFVEFDNHYQSYVKSWAITLLEELQGGSVTQKDIDDAITASQRILEEFATQAQRDRARDFSSETKVGYGVDSLSEEVVEADFIAVRGEI